VKVDAFDWVIAGCLALTSAGAILAPSAVTWLALGFTAANAIGVWFFRRL